MTIFINNRFNVVRLGASTLGVRTKVPADDADSLEFKELARIAARHCDMLAKYSYEDLVSLNGMVSDTPIAVLNREGNVQSQVWLSDREEVMAASFAYLSRGRLVFGGWLAIDAIVKAPGGETRHATEDELDRLDW